jgi:hypothetical protein
VFEETGGFTRPKFSGQTGAYMNIKGMCLLISAVQEGQSDASDNLLDFVKFFSSSIFNYKALKQSRISSGFNSC